ncbi:MAG: hypothetical protein ACK5L3_05130, partial [Oscillospiraceae bacterium]
LWFFFEILGIVILVVSEFALFSVIALILCLVAGGLIPWLISGRGAVLAPSALPGFVPPMAPAAVFPPHSEQTGGVLSVFSAPQLACIAQVYLNGGYIGSLLPGQTLQWPLPQGRHSLGALAAGMQAQPYYVEAAAGQQYQIWFDGTYFSPQRF